MRSSERNSGRVPGRASRDVRAQTRSGPRAGGGGSGERPPKTPPRPAPRPGRDGLCWGRNPVLALLRDRPRLCREVFLAEGAGDAFCGTVSRLCGERGVPLAYVPRGELDRATEGAAHQGVAAKVRPLPPADLAALAGAIPPGDPALIVLLDHCQDPHNLGAVIRTAESAGAACVVCQNDRSATVGGTVVKTSAGAAFRLPVAQVVNAARALESLKGKGFWAVGLDHRAEETLWSVPLPARLVLVVGSEGDGISPLVAKNCDKLVRIPMAGGAGSLNAGVAAAVGMFEWARVNGLGGNFFHNSVQR